MTASGAWTGAGKNGLGKARLQEIAASAPHGCPLSRALASDPGALLEATLERGDPA